MADTHTTLGGDATAVTPGRSQVRTCSVCKKTGHNKRTCKPSTLRVTVFENGTMRSADDYSGNELEALEHGIYAVWNWNPKASHAVKVDFRDDAMYLVCENLETGKTCPFPESFKTMMDGERKMIGDRIPIDPPQYGLYEWPADVKVQFAYS